MAAANRLSCRELVELSTDYLENALAPAERGRVEAHLAGCPGCQTYLQQMRQVVGAVGRLGDDPVPADVPGRLLKMFREHQAQKAKGAARTVPLGIGNQHAALGDHIGYFWESDEDFEAGVGFLEVGLTGKDVCVVFGHEPANQRVISTLWKRGLNVDELIQQRRLCVLEGDHTGEAMLTSIGGVFQAAVAGGAPVLRLLGNIGWGRPNWPRDSDILRFEATVTEAAKQFPCVIVCMYDVRSLPGRIILRGGFETHPLTVRNSVLRQNPHYVPLEPFLTQLEEDARLGRIQ